MNQVKIDAMQKVLPVEKRVVGGDSEWCVSLGAMATLYKYQWIESFCATHHLNLIDDVNMVRDGKTIWIQIWLAVLIVKKQKDLNQSLYLEYLQSFIDAEIAATQSFDETHEVAE